MKPSTQAITPFKYWLIRIFGSRRTYVWSLLVITNEEGENGGRKIANNTGCVSHMDFSHNPKAVWDWLHNQAAKDFDVPLDNVLITYFARIG